MKMLSPSVLNAEKIKINNNTFLYSELASEKI